jgi:CMP-N-acetylneuraminic acid synthetase
MKFFGLITARGGSKRLPGKNIKEFHKKPLLVWTIDVGKKANVFDEFILSTDSLEIADIGKKNGIDVPFIRPTEFATDTASSFDVVKHAVEWMKKNKDFKADWIILLEPTSPGRQTFHIQDVVELAKDCVADSIVGISEVPGHFSYLKQQKICDNGRLVRAWDGENFSNLIHRNQDLELSYYVNSSIYAFKYENLFSDKESLWGESTYGYLMDSKYAFDIDTQEDWMIAELKMEKLLKNIY